MERHIWASTADAERSFWYYIRTHDTPPFCLKHFLYDSIDAELVFPGCVLTVSLWIIGHNTNVHPYYFLLFDAPLALGGSGVLVLLAAYCYLCDVTTESSRAFR